MADIAVDIRARSAGESRCLARLSRLAGIPFLGDANARLAMDDADHCLAGATAGVGWTLLICVASPLRRGCRRDRRCAIGPWPVAAGLPLHGPQRLGARVPHTV